jgi:RNA polymerase sigma factor (sigma-70 family)
MMYFTPSHKEQQFTEVFYASKDKLYAFLLLYTDDKHFIEDIMQACYIRVWEKMEQWGDPDKLLPLIKTIARNLLLNALREKAKLPVEWLEKYQADDMGACQQDQQQLRTSLQLLDTTINQLPEQCRKVFLLHRELGLSYYEIAEKLTISTGTVKNHMSKAIHLLKTNMDVELLAVTVLLASIQPANVNMITSAC